VTDQGGLQFEANREPGGPQVQFEAKLPWPRRLTIRTQSGGGARPAENAPEE
jgi:hypothetical protein